MTKEIMVTFILGILLPVAAFRIVGRTAQPFEVITDIIVEDPQEFGTINRIPVLTENGTVALMDIEEYVLGVVLAEMPAEFHKEALKAQAVAARTVACKGYYGSWKHVAASVCTDPSCCQAYCRVENYLGTESNLNDVKNAVSETKGQVLMYGGKYVEATYFSCSGGRTEDALAVWGTHIPYLQAKDSPGEEDAEHYYDIVTFSKPEFCAMLGIEENAILQILSISYTSGGGVDTICISGKMFQGTQLRKLLNLRSTSFSISFDSQNVTIQTKGFGHRVGMSQYGAQAMACSGSSYEEILQYYYPGTEIVNKFG